MRFGSNGVSLAQNFRYKRSSPTNHAFFVSKKTSINVIWYKNVGRTVQTLFHFVTVHALSAIPPRCALTKAHSAHTSDFLAGNGQRPPLGTGRDTQGITGENCGRKRNAEKGKDGEGKEQGSVHLGTYMYFSHFQPG